jgi:hypothetical protein
MSEVMSVVVGVGRGVYDAELGAAPAGLLEEARVGALLGAAADGAGAVVSGVAGLVGVAVVGVAAVGLPLTVPVGTALSAGAGSSPPRLTAYAMPRPATSRTATASAARVGVSDAIDRFLRVGACGGAPESRPWTTGGPWMSR